ncbi:2-phospho-L-lactate guanylyltransferase [Zhongshania aliphaticivorans]|uniref:3-phospho-D-glycerate guanylyltransferase n=1 Tax=Zhongshania aliphaticivorans TaxID=1470434 RepID=A0A5S9N7T2_9GAMM|nr:2-phospho-L-lactate guanylyltransferase [Zhongshania aliphaticivorans]CAA0079678.1 2-phospho-L-lactate guanylyltransferase [Zhongshania aliphaticivorans]CAA0086024.1 2-phospho-L-lactate guanylyltransferase [Zhongshania aliphaticivorans]
MWALLPLKDFVQAKQRLAGSLTVSERRGLFHAMVEDVLTILVAHPGLTRIVVVSDDPAAQLLAEHYEVDCWSERDLNARGLNDVVTAALHRVADLTKDNLTNNTAAMVVHGDLPLLSGQELTSLIGRHAELMLEHPSAVSIATDRHGQGSNILVCDPANIPRFAYGSESRIAHYNAAMAMGLPAQVINLPGIAQDIDIREDLQRLLATPVNSSAKHTLLYLQQAGVAQRLQQLDGNAANISPQAWSVS